MTIFMKDRRRNSNKCEDARVDGGLSLERGSRVRGKLAEKIADEVLSIQKAWVDTVKKERGGRFKVSDWQPMLHVKESFFPCGKQSKDVFDLYSASAKAAYDVIGSLTDYVRPEDE